MSPRKFLSTLTSIALLALVPCTVACSASSESADDTVDDESDVKAGTLLGEVGAMKLRYHPNFVAGKKLKAVLANLGLQPGAKKPKEGALRCMPKFQLELFKPNGEPLATAEFDCDGEKRTDVPGTLKIVGGKSYLITAKDLDDINIASQDPSTVGELLFGADRATIGRPGADATEFSGAKLTKVMAALKDEEIPNFRAEPAGRRCAPARMVTLFRGDETLGIIAMNCSEEARGWVPGTLTPMAAPRYNRLTGAITINATAIFALEK